MADERMSFPYCAYCGHWPTLEAWDDAETLRHAGEELKRLRSVALAARALVQSANNRLAADELEEIVSEPALTELEGALERAGYGEEEAADG